MDKIISVGFIGTGARGGGLIKTILGIDGVKIIAVCDVYEDKRKESAERIKTATGEIPFDTGDYNDIINMRPDVIIIATSWESHFEIAIKCIEAGLAVGLEVGGAYELDDCWKLVEAWEKHKTPFMFLENCCYNKDELLATSLVRHGLLGRIMHCQGAYGHDCRSSIASSTKQRRYRLRNYLSRNCDNYPTHDLGPISKVLNINRGNRLMSIVSMSSDAAGMDEYVKNHPEHHEELLGKKFKQGDIFLSMIKTYNGETIIIKLDTTLPRLYDREFTLNGTKGMYSQTTQSVYIDNGENHEEIKYSSIFLKQDEFNDYLPDVWKNITEEEIQAGHGGMDVIMMREFFKALRTGGEMPIDVYDAALWMSITPLSERSAANGSIPLEIPDFTKGAWKVRPPKDVLPLIK